MSKKSSYLLGIFLTILIGTLLYWYFCCNCCSEDSCEHKDAPSVVETPEVKEATRNAFSIADGNFSINANDHFNFKGSDFKILEPISEKVTNSISELKTYFDTNPNKHLDITGYYTSNETNTSAFPNLGLARANSVKNYLISLGFPSKAFNTLGVLKDELVPDANNVYFGPVDFGVKTFDDTDAEYLKALEEACDAIRTNPLVLYFDTGEAQINLTVEQRQKIADISRCVDQLGVKVQVVGHTDNTGNADNNIVLGQQRADFAKSYLVRNGILNANVEATSKGQTEPIADNATDEGKAKNRRTVITIN